MYYRNIKLYSLCIILIIHLYTYTLYSQISTLWTKTFGGSGTDMSGSIQQTTDEGYIITGSTNSFGAGDYDVWLIKTNADGDTIWTKTFGGSKNDTGQSVQQTLEGGFIISGYTESFGLGFVDVWLIKTDANGDTIWTKTFGGSGDDRGCSVQQTVDEGYIVTGYTNSFSDGNNNVWLIKTNANGAILWSKTFDGKNHNADQGYSVQQTIDEGFIITGCTNVFGVGGSDVWLIKTNADGDTIWTKTFGGSEYNGGVSGLQTMERGYIVTGITEINDKYDVWLIKTTPEDVPAYSDLQLMAIEFDPSPPVSGTQATIYITIKNIGNKTWKAKDLAVVIRAIDWKDYGNGDSFWLALSDNAAQIRQDDMQVLSFTSDIDPNTTVIKQIPFTFTAPDFTDEVEIELLPATIDGSVDNVTELNIISTGVGFEVIFNNNASINCIGEILTGLTGGIVNNSTICYPILITKIFWRNGFAFGYKTAAFIDDLEKGEYFEAAKKAIKILFDSISFINMEIAADPALCGIAPVSVLGKISTVLSFISAAIDEFNGIGCGALLVHEIIITKEFISGLFEEAYSNFLNIYGTSSQGVIVASPLNLQIVDQSGDTTFINQDGNHKTEISNSLAFLFGELKCVYIVDSLNLDYQIQLQGTDNGKANITVFQGRQDSVSNFINFSDVNVTTSTKAFLDLNSTTTEYNLQIDNNGDGSIDTTITPDSVTTKIRQHDKSPIITDYKLEQNYPNPFNPTTTFKYYIPKSDQVTISICTISGQIIESKTMNVNPGTHTYEFDGTNYSSGIYLYRISTSSGYNSERKMLLLK